MERGEEARSRHYTAHYVGQDQERIHRLQMIQGRIFYAGRGFEN